MVKSRGGQQADYTRARLLMYTLQHSQTVLILLTLTLRGIPFPSLSVPSLLPHINRLSLSRDGVFVTYHTCCPNFKLTDLTGIAINIKEAKNIASRRALSSRVG